MRSGNDVIVSRCRHQDIHLFANVIETDDPVALHRRLQGTNRVDLGDPDRGPEPTQGLRTAFADITITADDGYLAGNHDVRRALDAVDEGLAATVEIVELGFRDRIVDIQCRAH